MQLNDLLEVLAAAVFGGNELVAGLFLAAIVTVMMMGLLSLANPPPMAYIMVAFMGVLMAMGLGWIDFWIAVMIGIVAVGGIALRLSEAYRA